MDFKDYYSTLGVAKTATAKEIKAAYRKLARKHHPDVNPGDKSAEARIKELNEANEVLSDPENGRNTTSSAQTGAPTNRPDRVSQGHAPGFDPSQGGGWNVNYGGGPGSRTMTEDEMNEMFGRRQPLLGLLSDLLRRRGAGRRRAHRVVAVAPPARGSRDAMSSTSST